MLGVMVDESGIRARWLIVREELDERGRRMWAAAEASSHGRGGIAAVVRATAISEATVRRGIAEVRSGQRAPAGRVRRAGAGRPGIEAREAGLREALLALIEGATRGDPMSPLRWTTRSVAKLTVALQDEGFSVSESTTRRELRGLGFSLQGNRKTHEGADHPDRDAQFEHIAKLTGQALATGQPVISVDTKKKELIGNYKNAGRELAARGTPILVNTHDFPDKEQGKAVPYGIYDVGRDEGWVSVGISGDTAQFAVAAIEGWWEHLGHEKYPAATELTITADCGGSNSYRTRLWKTELQRLSDHIGLPIRVAHFPPGTSKWNKIEHRLFSYISINWRAKPLVSRQTVIDLIAATTTSTGLKVYARLDSNTYPTKIKVTDEQIKAVQLTGERLPSRMELPHHPNTNSGVSPKLADRIWLGGSLHQIRKRSTTRCHRVGRMVCDRRRIDRGQGRRRGVGPRPTTPDHSPVWLRARCHASDPRARSSCAPISFYALQPKRPRCPRDPHHYCGGGRLPAGRPPKLGRQRRLGPTRRRCTRLAVVRSRDDEGDQQRSSSMAWTKVILVLSLSPPDCPAGLARSPR
jgi:hypothetical protein